MCVIHLFRDSVKVRYGRLSEVGRQPRFSDTLVSVFKHGLRLYIYIYIYIYMSHIISHTLVKFVLGEIFIFGRIHPL